MNRLAIMQGRLSPPPSDRLQAFPWNHWEEEFTLARACGFDAIEWLFEIERFEENPIWSDAGVARMRALIARTGTEILTLRADYFMKRPIFAAQATDRAASVGVLTRLITQAATVGIRTVLLPILEVSELRTRADRARLLESLEEVAPLAEAHEVTLGLETELPAGDYLALVQDAARPAIGAYYDTGNAAARGWDAAADIRVLGPVLAGVHIKDRPRGGPSVPLGEGAADFDRVFPALREVGYTRPLVLQPAFGADYAV